MRSSKNGEYSHTRTLTDTNRDIFDSILLIFLSAQGITAEVSRASEGKAVCYMQRETVRLTNAEGPTRTVA
eukprot:COSAG02_NODE_6948_length_3269_cov_2.137855_2_plen_71_part_00